MKFSPLFITTTILAAAATTVAAPTVDSPFGLSTGHNLDAARLAANAVMRPAKSEIRAGGIAPLARRAKTQTESTAVLQESFESCQLDSGTLPEGWTQTSTLDSADPLDHWYGVSRAYAGSAYYPMPADGNMMLGVYYDSERQKDEWLISPQVEIPGEGYSLSYSWFTTPLWCYVIDRWHVDFNTGKFIDRVVQCNFEVLVQDSDSEWEKVYDLESQLTDMEYSDLSTYELPGLVPNAISLDQYSGHKIRVAFRYCGIDGDLLLLDDVRIDYPLPDASYMQHPSRLFYGFNAIDPEAFTYLPEAIEFYPVGGAVTWENTSDSPAGTTYSWSYLTTDADGRKITLTDDSDPDALSVTYHPDYTSEATLHNNLLTQPVLTARATSGSVKQYSAPASLLQAGGTPEVLLADGSYMPMTALPFDINTERIGIHTEDSDDLGLFSVPIFGYNSDADKWWEHYSYPTGSDGRYSYVDGFLNLYIPNPEAPLVVDGATAMALGEIGEGATFTMKVYSMDSDGYLFDTPIATATISGSDVITVFSGYDHVYDYLALPFVFDSPLVLSAEGTGYGYMFEVSGYRDPENIGWFAPLQSLVRSANHWNLGFYHHYAPFHDSLTDEISYVGFFKTDWGDDLETAFAIGLDAHYPWLEAVGGTDITIDGSPATATIHGYYPAETYTVDAPEWLNVDLQGRYVTTATFSAVTSSAIDRTATVTIKAPGVSLKYFVTAKAGDAGIGDIESDATIGDIYNLQGIRAGSGKADLEVLPAGTYIAGGRKITKK